ncbi:Hypothetical protein CINCED_3A019604 [Cinara cedri]|uniref:Uncharacterized protein n=1 Tax=Cinara cedri TaxID=506608 RepID=A0A5E4NEI1_9HEMI|nr:Hypothetical protein CINCED_3A019604 [Cinara cedri]
MSTHKSSLAVSPRTSTSKPQKTSSKKRKPLSSSSKKPPPSRTSDTFTRPQPAQRKARPRTTRRRYDAKKTTVRTAFNVDMIRPFSRSTIGYIYTKLRSPTVTPQPTCATRTDQAHSVCISPYGCDGGNGQRGCQKRRWPRRRNKIYGKAGNYLVVDDRATNTVFPLPSSFPVGSPSFRAHGAVFQVPADQLDLLYTVPRFTVGSHTTSRPKVSEQDETASNAFSTSDEDYDNTSEHEVIQD